MCSDASDKTVSEWMDGPLVDWALSPLETQVLITETFAREVALPEVLPEMKTDEGIKIKEELVIQVGKDLRGCMMKMAADKDISQFGLDTGETARSCWNITKIYIKE
jgi:hypothetical protein